MTILDDRLAMLDSIHLDRGGHESSDEGMCAMEAAAWLAGEEWSDHPKCVSPVIGAFMRSWNDGLSDADRDRLVKPLVPLTIGTKTTKRDEEKRAWMATDWMSRECAPAWLRLAGLADHAVALEGLAPILSPSSAKKGQAKLDEASAAAAASWAASLAASWDASWDASRDASRAASRAASWDASWDASLAASWDASLAASRDASLDASLDASRAASLAAKGGYRIKYAVARKAADAALAPTTKILQASAVLLVTRMCEVGR